MEQSIFIWDTYTLFNISFKLNQQMQAYKGDVVDVASCT